MTNPAIELRSGGPPTNPDVLVRDAGVVIPGNNSIQQFTDARIVAALRKSRDLRVLATDLSQGAESTLMVGDDTQEFADTLAQEFLGQTAAWSQSTGSTTNTTTSSASDVAMNSMSLTVTRTGKYLIVYAATVGNSGANNDTFTSIYVNGVKQEGERKSDTLVAAYRVIHAGVSVLPTTIPEGQVVEVRWRTTAGTATAENRTLAIVWLGED